MKEELQESPRIFISYRRSDASWLARLVATGLAEIFGEGNVFLDVETISPGQTVSGEIGGFMADPHVVIAIIGPGWEGAPNEPNRLLNDNDWVRQEIAAALSAGTAVIPVLADKTSMPLAGQLPADLAALADINALSISHQGFHKDFTELVRAVWSAWAPDHDVLVLAGSQHQILIDDFLTALSRFGDADVAYTTQLATGIRTLNFGDKSAHPVLIALLPDAEEWDDFDERLKSLLATVRHQRLLLVVTGGTAAALALERFGGSEPGTAQVEVADLSKVVTKGRLVGSAEAIAEALQPVIDTIPALTGAVAGAASAVAPTAARGLRRIFSSHPVGAAATVAAVTVTAAITVAAVTGTETPVVVVVDEPSRVWAVELPELASTNGRPIGVADLLIVPGRPVDDAGSAIVALGMATGEVAWRMDDIDGNCLAVDASGTLVAQIHEISTRGSSDLVAIDPRTGTVLPGMRYAALGSETEPRLAACEGGIHAAPDGALLLSGYSDFVPTVWAFDTADGLSLRWVRQYERGVGQRGTVAVVAGKVVYPHHDGERLVVDHLDLASGDVIGSVTVPGIDFDEIHPGSDGVSQPVLLADSDGGVVLATSEIRDVGYRIRLVPTPTGIEIAWLATNDQSATAPEYPGYFGGNLAETGGVLATQSGREVVGLDLESGDLSWVAETSTPNSSLNAAEDERGWFFFAGIGGAWVDIVDTTGQLVDDLTPPSLSVGRVANLASYLQMVDRTLVIAGVSKGESSAEPSAVLVDVVQIP